MNKTDDNSLSITSRAEKLLWRYGWNTMCWQTLNPELTLWFSENKEGVIAFTRHRNLIVTVGAPITAPENLLSFMREFEAYAKKEKLSVCYFAAEERLRKILSGESGYSAMILGAHPVWNPGNWKTNKSITELIRYARRRKVIIQETLPENINDPDYRECLIDWLKKRKLPALGFLVNPPILTNIQGKKILTARQNGKVTAFLILSPVPKRNGWLIEHIIRGKNTVKGTCELLVDEAMRLAVKSGSCHATLGLAPLSQRAEISYCENPYWVRGFFKWLYMFAGGFYNFKGLDYFKAKFKPSSWEPVYAIINKSGFSPITLYDIAGAFCRMSPFKFLTLGILRLIFEQSGGIEGA